ncbi:hypothetical protein [Marinifilum flexuosum]|uniref:Uncharacterized protein n=1 Tax=Marinifilum flexuosum TaxID=1117708 RepID=A0A419WWD2_9BACT|nr:hypothetical protein [Marinifilum flexuosum]RKD99769.1 hypothetical protein BXY64_2750 [Marinifilum flexuosum]
MRKNDFITAIFEEIKESLLVIDGKLENGQSGDEKRKIVIPKELVEFLNRSIDQSVRENISRLNLSSQDQFRDLNQKLGGLIHSVKELTKVRRKRKLIFRKLVVWQSISALLLMIGLTLFIHNRQLSDNALKFRYIEACGGIDSKKLLKLDTVFHVNRDELVIEKMKNKDQ